MNKTKIEWVKNPNGSQGYTWNPVTGCLNHKNGLCKGGGFPCYAYRLAHGRLKSRYWANHQVAIPDGKRIESLALEAAYNDPFYPRFWPERLWDGFFHPERDTNYASYRYDMIPPRGIFVCDMGELFGDWIPEKWQRRIFEVIRNNHWHRFYLLTKQPQNLTKWSPFPDNCWVGVTATDHLMFAHAYYHLADIEAKIKYISIEPLLNWDNRSGVTQAFINQAKQSGVGWLIIGGQSGKNKFYPPEDWIQEIESACDKAKIPVFEKDNLKKIWERIPRQEMP